MWPTPNRIAWPRASAALRSARACVTRSIGSPTSAASVALGSTTNASPPSRAITSLSRGAPVSEAATASSAHAPVRCHDGASRVAMSMRRERFTRRALLPDRQFDVRCLKLSDVMP